MRLLLILTVVWISGCFPNTAPPEDWMIVEGERMMVAYEDWTGTYLSDSQAACILDFQIAYVNAEEMERWCGSVHTACMTDYDFKPRQNTLLLLEGRWAPLDDHMKACGIRHEVVHLILRCTNGEGNNDHTSEFFDGGGNYFCGGPNSLVNYADNF